ncbi:hypothetical protein GLAREA_03482 [Glarea lozoyensis ATCC 20868]|uniref:Heterokaryon incompatibility domain-containing protein n=1 Tax=Glarea lozoyensis (strain ATCC 20868 / MF5171) TaxID=1116229 RepID=S3CY28_GLAL2|nr:uncharacterized protein GLAREA_03482 [Glarea lozoyensis ATCC 20868]EPE30515.1 hypothetical protein GLAREA_03482 [Glarea lozoyensis ATCC 20868]
MPFIYARAQQVIVWLGLGLEHILRVENNIRSQKEPKHQPANYLTTLHKPGEFGAYTVAALCHRDYWKRLWIIQEIGKSAHGALRIHYDATTIPWDLFIEILGAQKIKHEPIPLKLDAQRKVRFVGGHTLANLLISNEHALCKDPHDKICRFIGLAVDVYDRFPMDYWKSLFEVFYDTIQFMNSDASRSQHDILGMSRLVGRMLGGPMGIEPDWSAQDFNAGNIDLKPSLGTIRVPARIVGRIREVGPLHSDLVAKTEKLNAWTSLIWRNILETPLRSSVLEQSELFLEALRVFDDISQCTIFAFDSTITWEETKQHTIESFDSRHDTEVIPAFHYQPGARLVLLQPDSSNLAPSWVGLALGGVSRQLCLLGVKHRKSCYSSSDRNR